jgi:predicted esterase
LNQATFSSRSVLTSIHGRVLTRDAADSLSPDILVVFHGYAQSADVALMDVSPIPGIAEGWRVVAIQGLHRFYAKDERVVASWMTRQDRDDAIADNVAYVDRVVAEEIARLAQDDRRPVRTDDRRPVRALDRHRIVFLGFSQGASMAYRSAVLGRHAAAGVIALAGDIPPEVKQSAAERQPWPRVLIGVGDQEHWYTPDKVSADSAFLVTRGVKPDICRFNGGHEWTAEFRAAAGQWLDALA